MSRVIRVDADVYERICQVGLVLDAHTPSAALWKFMQLTQAEQQLLLDEIEAPYGRARRWEGMENNQMLTR